MGLSVQTGAMRDYPLLKFFITEAGKGMGGATEFEGANFLVIFALEEEVHARAGRGAAFEGSADEGFCGLRC